MGRANRNIAIQNRKIFLTTSKHGSSKVAKYVAKSRNMRPAISKHGSRQVALSVAQTFNLDYAKSQQWPRAAQHGCTGSHHGYLKDAIRFALSRNMNGAKSQ